MLEGPDLSDIRSLLNVLLVNDTQVLEGSDVNIRSLLNVLPVVTSFNFTVFVCSG